MTVMQRSLSAGLVALSLTAALAATAPAAQAHDNLWPGVAAGLAGGIIGGAIVAGSQPVYVAPAYGPPPPPPPVYYRRAYYAPPPPPPAPRCHYQWVDNGWGAYRARVCPAY